MIAVQSVRCKFPLWRSILARFATRLLDIIGMYAAEKVNPVHLQLGNRDLLIGCKPYQTRKSAFWELDYAFAVVRLFWRALWIAHAREGGGWQF